LETSNLNDIVLIRGGGDLASGVALRLYRAGMRLLITELPQPLVIRRLVSFAEAVYNEETTVEEVTALLGYPGSMERASNPRAG
jgi:xanthine dehydrogenase accessory factor